MLPRNRSIFLLLKQDLNSAMSNTFTIRRCIVGPLPPYMYNYPFEYVHEHAKLEKKMHVLQLYHVFFIFNLQKKSKLATKIYTCT
jgi:hypothetical protein